MGSHNLEVFIKTKSEKVFKKKMDELFERERQYHGSDPYSGSWATIDGVRIVSDPFPEMKKWTKKKVEKVEEWLLDNTQKWEPAKAVKTSTGYIVVGWAVS